jgi:hypothetical protein
MEQSYSDLGDTNYMESVEECFDKSYNKLRDEGWE